MRGDVYVSSGGKLRRLATEGEERAAETPLAGCGAVCARGGTVYAASDKEGVIYRLDERMLPCGVYAGGPGMREICVSDDGTRLYALLADADSVLMMDARDGAPMFLARAGVSPCRMHLDDDAGTLTIAGGRSGGAAVVCVQTLNPIKTCVQDGFCCDALCVGERLCMLLLTPSHDSRLAVCARDQRGQMLLPGMPGALCRLGRALLVSAGDWLYTVDPARMRLLRKARIPGLAGKMVRTEKGFLLLCPMDESLHLLGRGGARLLCMDAQDAAAE